MVQQNTMSFWIISILKWIQITMLDPILKLFLGYTTLHGYAKDQLASASYEKSAQRVKILGRGAYSVGIAHFLENFLYKHVNYLHPKEVLKSDNITLMVSLIHKYKFDSVLI